MIEDLVRAFGQSVGIRDLRVDEDGFSAVAVGDRLIINFQYVEDADVIVVFTELGEVSRARETEVYRAMLDANFFWQGTGGAVLALEAESRTAVLMTREPLEGLTPEAFEHAVGMFAKRADEWIERLAELNGQVPAGTASA
jgi:hypothetical protein